MAASPPSPQQRAGCAASVAGLLYPIDMKETNPEALAGAAVVYYEKLLEESSSAPEFFSVPGREKVQLEASLMHFLPLYREDSKYKILVLTDPQDKKSVCQKFLEIHPEEQSRLWEVEEAPGDWSQRVSIWLKIQLESVGTKLEQNVTREVDLSSPVEQFQDDEPGQSDDTQKNKRDGHIPKSLASPVPNSTTKEFNCEQEDVFDLWSHDEEHLVQHTAEVQQSKRSKKRASCGETSEDSIPKHFRPLP